MRQMTSQSFVIKLKQSSQGAEYAGTDQSHDDAGQKHAAHAGKDCRLEFHIKKTGSQDAGPGSGSGKWNTYEQKQSDKKTAACGILQLLTAPLPLVQAPVEELADVRLVSTPYKDLAGEQVNKRNGNHITEHADDVGRQKI